MIDYEELREGLSLGGLYILERRMREDRAGIFFAALSDEGERVMVKLSPDGPQAERQFAAWLRSRGLRHPSLLAVRDVGRADLMENTYIYAVFDYPDDVLSSALENGPLGEPETAAVFEATLDAVRYLHAQGLVHGVIDPEHVVAVGDTVKLAAGELHESDDPEERTGDLRQLGDLARRLRAPEPLSESLAAMVRRVTATGDPQPVEADTQAAPGEAARQVHSAAPLVLETAALPRPRSRGPLPPRSPMPFPKWIFAGVAIVLLAILASNVRRKPDAVPAVPVAPISATPAPPPPVSLPHATQPHATPARVEPPRPAPPRSNPASPATWRVIAFTYRSREQAVKKVEEVNGRWPDLHAEVFRPRGSRDYFLVALGDRMTRDEAVELQRKARSRGLPRDSYVQNYNESGN